jgi:hypothetical protein
MTASSTPAKPDGIRDRIVELVRIRAGDLRAHPSNWRRHPAGQRAALRGVLAEIGYADALIAHRDAEELVLIDGHLRQSLDPDQVVPVLVLDVDAEEAEKLLVSLDPIAALAQPDPEALGDLLGRVETSSEGLLALLGDLARSAGVGPAHLLSDPDEVPEAPSSPRCRRGDLWVLGEHRLLCGDATDPQAMQRLMEGTSAQVLFTDPPYGVDYVGKTPDALRIQGDQAQGLGPLLGAAFAAADESLAPGAALYVCHPEIEALAFLQAFAAQGWHLAQGLVWVKDSMVLGHTDYHYRHEPIAFGYKPGPGRRGRGGAGWYGGDAQDSVLEVPRRKRHASTRR